jgi:hypothetical protein
VEKAITVETGQADREANLWAFTNPALELLEASIGKSGRFANRPRVAIPAAASLSYKSIGSSRYSW